MCLALPGRIESTRAADGGLRFGSVRFGTLTRDVCLEYVPEAEVGDWVIVHVGFAIQRLDEAAAAKTLRLLEELEA